MAGGNRQKGSSHKPSSSSSNRKSRWESGSNPPPDQKPPTAVQKPPIAPTSKPSSHPNDKNLTPPLSGPTPSPAHPRPSIDQAPHSGSISIPPQGAPGGAPFPPNQLGEIPPPAYGFHMLDRRTIVLADGSVRSYLALPPDYQDLAPPGRPLDAARRFIRMEQENKNPEFGGMGPGFDKRFPPAGPMSAEGFPGDREDPHGRGRPQDYWNSLGLDVRGGPGEGSLKRKYGDEDERNRRDERDARDVKDEYARQRQQLLQYGNQSSNPNGYPLGMGERGEFLAGTSNPFLRDEELRSSKHMRMGGGYESLVSRQGGGVGGDNAGLKHHDVDHNALKKAFVRFVKLLNENANQRKSYLEDGKQGPFQCVVCGRSSKDFPDVHCLIMHAYHSDNADLRVDHLGLHKALCVLMGWNYAKPPDNSRAYQSLSADEAAVNRDDLIMWPPVVIIHNTITGKSRDGRMEGLGNKVMDTKLRGIMRPFI